MQPKYIYIKIYNGRNQETNTFFNPTNIIKKNTADFKIIFIYLSYVSKLLLNASVINLEFFVAYVFARIDYILDKVNCIGIIIRILSFFKLLSQIFIKFNIFSPFTIDIFYFSILNIYAYNFPLQWTYCRNDKITNNYLTNFLYRGRIRI